MFVQIPGMSDGFYLAWAFVTYIIMGNIYIVRLTFLMVPWLLLLQSDPVERTTLSTWRTVGAMLAN